jgi:acetyl esterase/lipase
MSSPSKHLVDPELLSLLDTLPALELTEQLLPIIRAMDPPFVWESDVPLAAVDMSKRSIPGPRGAPDVQVIVYRPTDHEPEMPGILHIHGGGYVIGNAASLEPVHRQLSFKTHCAIVSVDYRLAPETRAPGAVEDCYAALAWLHRVHQELGIDVRRIGVMGESAGGGLAAALALLARDRGEYRLSFQHLFYPMLDDRTCVDASPSPFLGEFLWTRVNNAFGWSALLGVAPGSSGVSPYAAPARAAELKGLPPTYLATGALDLFVEENLDYSRRLLRAGVPVELHVYPGAYHGFDWARDARVAKQARRDSLEALKLALARR